jgi:hypothetical protein
VVAFDVAWDDLTRRLKPNQEFSGWSRDRGVTALKFQIAEIEPTSITVLPGRGKQRRISKGDFAQVFAFWAEYCRGEIPRHKMAELSQNTSYIFSILRWQEMKGTS